MDSVSTTASSAPSPAERTAHAAEIPVLATPETQPTTFSPTPPAMVVSDMDGTLLGLDGQVSARNAAALKRAEKAGARVVIATGRPLTSLTPVVDAGFDGLAVCMNGAVVYHIGNHQVHSAIVLEPTVMQEVVADLEQLPFGFGLAVDRITGADEEFWAEHTYHHPWADRSYFRTDRTDLLTEPAAKLLVAFAEQSDEIFDAAHSVGRERVSMTYSAGDGLLEVGAAGVSKGAALKELAASWGIDRRDVVAFGDMPNDLDMLAWAGRSVAMGNALGEVAAVASEVGPDHDDDGVAQVLERWF